MGLWSVMVAPWRSLLQVEGFSCVGEGWAVQGLGWGLFLFFFTGVANCGVGWREEERSYFTGRAQTHRMRERGVRRLDIHIGNFLYRVFPPYTAVLFPDIPASVTTVPSRDVAFLMVIGVGREKNPKRVVCFKS